MATKLESNGVGRMKRVLKQGTLTVVLMLLLSCWAFPALALEIRSSSNPSGLREPGEADIVLTIQNNSNEPATGMTLVLDDGSQQLIGDLDAKKSISVTVPGYNVTQEKLDASLAWAVTWTEGGLEQREDIVVRVPLQVGEAKLSLEVQPSKTVALEGDSISFSYTIRNSGDLTVNDIRIQDSISENNIASGITLQPGESSTASYSATMRSALTSEATAVGVGPDGQEVRASASQTKVTQAEEGLNIFLTELEASPGETGIDVQVINSGGVPLYQITLIDDLGTEIATDITLEPEQEEHFDLDVPNSEPRSVTVTANYTTEREGGTQHTASSEALQIEALYTAEEIQAGLTAVARADEVNLDAPGNVALKLTLNNSTPITLEDVVIKEVLAGTLQSLPTLAPGEQTIDLNADVTQSRDLQFIVSFKDSEGRSYEVTTDPVSIQVAAVAAVATPEALPAQDRAYVEILAIAALLAIAFVAVITSIIVLLVKRGQWRRGENRAEEDDDLLQVAQAPRRRAAKQEQTSQDDQQRQRIAMKKAREEQKKKKRADQYDVQVEDAPQQMSTDRAVQEISKETRSEGRSANDARAQQQRAQDDRRRRQAPQAPRTRQTQEKKTSKQPEKRVSPVIPVGESENSTAQPAATDVARQNRTTAKEPAVTPVYPAQNAQSVTQEPTNRATGRRRVWQQQTASPVEARARQNEQAIASEKQEQGEKKTQATRKAEHSSRQQQNGNVDTSAQSASAAGQQTKKETRENYVPEGRKASTEQTPKRETPPATTASTQRKKMTVGEQRAAERRRRSNANREAAVPAQQELADDGLPKVPNYVIEDKPRTRTARQNPSEQQRDIDVNPNGFEQDDEDDPRETLRSGAQFRRRQENGQKSKSQKDAQREKAQRIAMDNFFDEDEDY